MIVMTDYKAIIAFSVFAMLALAGSVVFVADDASADSPGYTVTYSLGGSSIVKTSDADGNITLLTAEDVQTVYTPEGKFLGWKTTDGDETGVVYDFGAKIKLAGNITLYPNVKPLQDVVYFDIEGKDRVTVSIADDRINQEVPANPEKEGFRFVGWMYSDDGKIYSAGDIKDETKIPVLKKESVFTAQFEPIYKITFVNGDSTYGETTDSVEREVPAAPSKEHYNFLGWTAVKDAKWTTEEEAKKILVPLNDEGKIDDSVVFTEDTTLYAVFAPLTYKVFFMNGETVVAERSSEYMGQIDLPALPEGFVAWADKDGNVVGSPVTITGPDMKFYAVEEVVKCTVTFVAGDETVASVEVVKGEKLAENQIPALPEGYDRWDFNADDAVTESIAVKGALKVYDVTFDFGVMYAAMNVTIQVEHGQLIPADKVPVIPEAFPEKDKRWNFDASAPVTGPMTIQLRDNIYYDVAFVAGETEVAKITVLEGTAVPAEQIPALPEGYKAWDFDFEALINENTVVKAVAEEASFNVTFQIEGKTDVTQKSDSLTVPATYREGYEFQGWVVAGTSDYVDPMEYAYTGDVTFVAIYRSIAPVAPEEPGFFETTSGQIALVVIVIVVLGAVALAVAPASPMNYKLVKGKLDAAKAAKEAKKKP